MSSVDNPNVDPKVLANSMASFLQILAVVILLYWCFQIISPFVSLIIWAGILSIAVYPAYQSLSARLGDRSKLSATLLILLGVAIILVPTWMLADSTIGGLRGLSTELADGTAHIPPPADSVADWPLIGDQVHEIWSGAANNLQETLNQFQPQLRAASQRALGFAGHTAGTVLLFVVAVIVAGVLFTSAPASYTAARNIAASLVGPDRAGELTGLSIQTIRSVAKGILGIAFLQAVLAAIGLVVAGVPAAGLWSGAVLVLAIVQLPTLLVLGPIAFWYFSVADPVPATIFLVYAVIVSISDTFLKPLLLGRGVDTPMLVILMGAIGGAIVLGIVGLFIGAVILALGYELLKVWMAPDETLAEVKTD